MTADASPVAPEQPLPNVPLIDRPGSASTREPLNRPALGVRKRLLVVDDEPPVLRLVERILSIENYEIRTADCGAAALRLIDEPGAAGVDLLVTDLMMPGITGRELAAIVRARYPSVRVLYQTGFSDNLFMGVHELAEGEAFIEKPFSTVGLLEATRLLMFGHIASDVPPLDKRDQESEWKDERLRAKVVRFLKRWKIA